MQVIPLNKLSLSKHNVRKTRPSEIEALAENIAAVGQLQNLTAIEGQDGMFEVVAGGRRLAAMQKLAKNGRLAEDAPVNVEVTTEDRAIEASLSENAMREGMHPADEFDAFKRLADGGLTEDQIGPRFGVTTAYVRQRMKLAVVSPKLVKAYRAAEMELAHLEAFTLTDDRKRQEKVWAELPAWAKQASHASQGASQIKAALTEGMVSADRDSRIRFVGMKALEEAGAVTGRDLFAEEGSGHLVDGSKLAEMVAAKMEALIAKEIKAGWKFAENATGMDWQVERTYGQIEPTLSDEQKAEIEKRNERLQEIEAAGDSADGDESDKLYEEQERIEAEIEQIEHEASFSDEDRARAGVLISIGHDGKPKFSRGRLSPEDTKAAHKAARGAHRANGAGEGAEQPREASGYSSALLEVLTAHRTAALQAKVAGDPHVALALALESLIVSTTPMMYGTTLAKITGRQPNLNGAGQEIEASPAAKELAKREKTAFKGMPEEQAELLPWLLRQKEPKLLAIMAVCTAKNLDAIERKLGERPSAASVAAVSEAVGLDMAEYWHATAANFFERIPAKAILASVEEACGKDAVVEIAGSKKADMCKRAETLMSGKRWVPQLMR